MGRRMKAKQDSWETQMGNRTIKMFLQSAMICFKIAFWMFLTSNGLTVQFPMNACKISHWDETAQERNMGTIALWLISSTFYN